MARGLAAPGVRCFVAAVGDGHEIGGFAALRGSELLHFGTAMSTWGTGLAGVFQDELVVRLQAQGYAEAWLRVFKRNPRARRFYARRSWHQVQGESQSLLPPHPVLVRYELTLL